MNFLLSAFYHPTFFEQNKALSLLWSQHHLNNPATKIHDPLHERLSIKLTINPDGC
ncbi:hypothetical protein [Nostoc sp.]|uniref:hypothetical protein n=1 Tax=Nostoc sp. TaxID=1180 RepID=UPI002FF524E8